MQADDLNIFEFTHAVGALQLLAVLRQAVPAALASEGGRAGGLCGLGGAVQGVGGWLQEGPVTPFPAAVYKRS